MSNDRTVSSTGAARSSARPPESLVGTVIQGRYRIDQLVGEGGMAAVYRAHHLHMRKDVAVKVLHAEMTRMREVVQRFEREAMAAAHIEHPNVAAAKDFGQLEDGSFFLVLEFVDGKSLRDLIAEGPLPLGRALRVLHQIAAALQRAHSLGIVHRDLKPENVMLVEREGETDFVKVLDFGIAKVPIGEISADGAPPGTALTQLGMVYGTPEYMAPEQALGQAVDPRADIYSLGVITFEMLAGVRPFEHASKVTLLGMHVTAPVPRIADKAPLVVVPEEIEAIIRKTLEKEAGHRYADSKELLEAIDAVWTGDYGPTMSVGPRGSLAGRPSTPQAEALPVSAPLPGAPAIVTGRQPPISPLVRMRENLLVQYRDNPRPFVIGGAAAFASVALLVLLARGGSSPTTPTTPTAPSSTTNADTPPATSDGATNTAPSATSSANPDVEARITAGVAAIERGDYGTGISSLAELEKDLAGRPEIHRALEKAYTATRKPKEALRQAALLIKADGRAANDLKLAENVRNAAVGRDAADDAFLLLESGMGTMGGEILYDIAYGASGAQYPAAAVRAQKALQKADARKIATPGLQVTLELRAAASCEAKRALLAKAREVGDSRTATVLKPHLSTRGCGFANARDCWPCLRKDNILVRTIQAIEERQR
ncbi:MAG: serine/threonine protein kinase [Myxococcales bacterium]|nr:serine/threonine protein kinase [Myxococcales bacterium]